MQDPVSLINQLDADAIRKWLDAIDAALMVLLRAALRLQRNASRDALTQAADTVQTPDHADPSHITPESAKPTSHQ